jgi:pectinesterase
MALLKTQKLQLSKTKPIPTLITLTFILTSVLCSSVLCASANSPTRTSAGFEFLNVAPSEFVGTVKDVIEILQDVTSILSEFGGSGFGDSRLSNAVFDCLEMLDLSSDALTWSVDATQTPKGTN